MRSIRIYTHLHNSDSDLFARHEMYAGMNLRVYLHTLLTVTLLID